METNTATSSNDCPITISVARRVKAGQEANYEAWIKGITAAAHAFPGHQGMTVLRPSAATKNQYVLIYHFDSYAHAQVWEESPERQHWIDQLPALVEGETERKKVTGLEFWFDLPTVPVTAKPSTPKMVLVMSVLVYSLVLLFSTLLAPLIGTWPAWAKLLIIIPTQVTLMTYFIMPRVTKLLKNWLYH